MKIATMLSSVTRTRSPLQKELASLTKVLGTIAWGAVAFIVIVGVARGENFSDVMLLGTAMAFAFARFRFFGRELVNFAVTLPIILPGVITGVALASFFLFTGTDLSAQTVIIGHTTFCIVLVFNNVLARLRRVSPSLEEASRDLGARGWQTFRYVTFPTIRTALIAGALLAFALSFDEIAVTFFLAGADTTTLPLWILGAFRNARALPEVNAVATVILIVSFPMIATAAYLMRDEGAGSRVVGE